MCVNLLQDEPDAGGADEVDGGGAGEETTHTPPEPVKSKLDSRVQVRKRGRGGGQMFVLV